MQPVPRSKHIPRVTAVCSEICTKPINALCGKNVELLDAKPGGTDSNHVALRGQSKFRVHTEEAWHQP